MVKKHWVILAFVALLLAGAQSAFALLVGVSATWDSTSVAANNLDAGSIVQVVAYSSANGGDYPGSTTSAAENFVTYGTTTTTEGTPPEEVTHQVYLPDTTKASGNQIIFTGTLQSDGNGGLKFQSYVYLENASAYDHIYIRVFSATEFPDDMNPEASYWGISDAQDITAGEGAIDVVWWNNVVVTNYDYFEVIPEPGTLGLLGSGAFGTVVAGLWRGRRKGKARAGETGVVEP